MTFTVQVGETPAPAPAAGRPGRPALPPQRRRLHPRHLPRARRHRRAVPGPLGGPRLAHLAVRRRGRVASPSSIRSPAQKTDELKLIKVYANSHYVTPKPTLQQAIKSIKAELKQRLDELDNAGRLLEAQRLEQRTAVRPGDDGGDRLLRRHRELLALPHRPPARRAAADPVRVPARQRAGVRRREPRHRAADRRHVPRRLPAQGDAGRIRLPPALLHGQPPAPLRGVGRHAAADHVRLGHARRLGDRADRRRVRRAGDPPHRPDRSAGGGAPGQDRRSTT